MLTQIRGNFEYLMNHSFHTTQVLGIKKGLQTTDFFANPLFIGGRHIQTRTGDLYDVNVAL